MRSLLAGVFLAGSCALIHLNAAGFVGEDIGSPALPGKTETNSSGAIVLSGAGASFGMRNADQAHFAWISQEGDFDWAVRLESLNTPDVFGRAGLMARDSLEPNSGYVAVLATPSIGGIVSQTRVGGSVRTLGNAFANYPYAWLRLQRKSNIWTTAASGDGRLWTRLDSAESSLGQTVYFGLMVNSWQSNQLATAVFRDLGAGQGDILPASDPIMEIPGPSNRRTGLVISEIMYHPARRADGRDLEFVEIFNSQSVFQDISGFRLSGALDFTFPEGTVLRAGQFAVVARVPADVRAVYGLTNVYGGYTNRLDNGSGTVRLRSRIGAVLVEAPYASVAPWPAAADGAGHSLVLARPSYGERDPKAWTASRLKGGSPGRWDGYVSDGWSPIVINEVRAHTTTPDRDYIELYNHSNSGVDLSGAWLSDSPETNKFRIPSGTTIPARGFVVFTESVLGFALNAGGETISLTVPDQSRVLDAVRFKAQGLGLAFGRTPDGSARWRTLAASSPGAPNAHAALPSLTFSEIMFNPVSGDDRDQYLELQNASATPLNLSGWRLEGGVRFTFPTGTIVPPAAYVVVVKNRERILTNYPSLNPSICYGDFQGTLSGRGEELSLLRPEVASNNPVDTNWIAVAEVRYGDGGRWGQWADGGGSSLELADPRSDPAFPSNWRESDETSKAPWTTVEHTGTLDLGVSNFGLNQLQILLEDVGECLVDNVEVIGPAGTNMVTNGDFENGLTGWVGQGSHRDTTLEAGTGINGSQCLHVRALSRGDPGANRIRGNVGAGLKQGDIVTIRAQVRWLRGFPEVLLRLRGNFLEATARLKTSTRLGTPGSLNSQSATNSGPAIYDVTHSPILPASNQDVVVTARTDDPDGVEKPFLHYRVDPATEYTDVAMRDDGTEGDAVADDGLFSATIPGQPASTLVAFYVEGTDQASNPASATFPSDAPARECLVRFGEIQPGGTFGVYRIWMTQSVRTKWTSREKLNNAPLDVTFVYGNQRVIYNVGAHYAGSPFVSSGYSGPTGALCGYVLAFPKDDRFLGVTDVKLDWPVRDPSLQMEQVAYWMADEMGLPSNHRRFVRLYVNGLQRGSVYEDAQQPNSDMIEQYFPDDADGDFYKIDDWFEFDNSATQFANTDATLDDFTTTGGEKKIARYRWNWRKRAVKDSTSDYRTLFALVDAARSSDYSSLARNMEAVMDVEEYLGIIAFEHLVGNWDSFGYYRGKNMYSYKPAKGKWNLLTWDIDFVLSADGYPSDSDLFGTIDPTISSLVYTPYFQRVYYRVLEKAVKGPLQPSKFSPVLQANYTALVANGLSPSGIGGGSNYLSGRLKFVTQQLNQAKGTFRVTPPEPSSDLNVIILQGEAPLDLREIRINGVSMPITWTELTRWQLVLPLRAATNHIQIVPIGASGEPIPGPQPQFDVVYNGTEMSPAGHIVFNEIMHHPTRRGAEFVELANNALYVFDLSGWRIDGLDWTFPEGSLIGPFSYLVLAKNRTAFLQTYQNQIAPAGEFPGELSSEGETLRLIQPGPLPGQETVIAQTTYSARAPWPAAANQPGTSLQLVNPLVDADRAGNWSVYSPPPPVEWEFVKVTGQLGSSNLLLYLSGFPAIRDPLGAQGEWELQIGGGTYDYRVLVQMETNATWSGEFAYAFQGQEQRFPVSQIGFTNQVLTFGLSPGVDEFRLAMNADGTVLSGTYRPAGGDQSYSARMRRFNPGGDVFLDDIQIVKGTEPETGENLVKNGGFEETLEGPWKVSSNHSASSIVQSAHHAGGFSLHLVASRGGMNETNAVWQQIRNFEPGAAYTLSYWVRHGSNATSVVVRSDDWGLFSIKDLRPVFTLPQEYTPGRKNSTYAEAADLPPIWINELAPVNGSGPVDHLGRRGAWVELVNRGTNDVALSGCFLSNAYTNLTQWAFPKDAILQAGQYVLVWLDGEPGNSTGTEWHSSVRVAADQGVLVLARVVPEGTQIVDYVEYSLLPSGSSIGWAGTSGSREIFSSPTPMLPNGQTIPPSPTVVLINEWMASNNAAVVDPSDGKFSDWLELYNPGNALVDLSGWTLSDDPGEVRKYTIPAGTVISAKGYLLIWADGDAQKTSLGGALHASFKLGADGETILLSWPDGRAADQVVYGPQMTDVSEGRWPDGTGAPFQRLSLPTPGAANVFGSEIRIASFEISKDGQLRLAWSSFPDERFRIQFTDDIGAGEWTEIPELILSKGTRSEVTVPLPPGLDHRFYRVILIP